MNKLDKDSAFAEWKEQIEKLVDIYYDVVFDYYDPIVKKFNYFMIQPSAIVFEDDGSYKNILAKTCDYNDVVHEINFEKAYLFYVGKIGNRKIIRFYDGL